METLQGQFLIATQQMPDPRFREQVVYICAHNEEGAMGLVINRPIDGISLADIFREADIEPPGHALPPVYAGGPVETNAAFVLFSSDYGARSCMPVGRDVFLSRDIAVLEDIARGFGPKNYMVLLGYSGWAPGQIEEELSNCGWLVLPADADLIFHTQDDLKWKNAAGRYGIDISTFSDLLGNA